MGTDGYGGVRMGTEGYGGVRRKGEMPRGPTGMIFAGGFPVADKGNLISGKVWKQASHLSRSRRFRFYLPHGQ